MINVAVFNDAFVFCYKNAGQKLKQFGLNAMT